MGGKTTTASLIRQLLPEAIDLASDGGRYVFSIRTLFYVIRQLFLTRFYVCPHCGGQPRLKEPPDTFECMGCGAVLSGGELKPKHPSIKFYKRYDSFTQDFLRSYEKRHGPIPNMYREERGEFTSPTEDGRSISSIIGGRRENRFIAGIGNKIIVVEKSGIYGTLVENNFHIRLDAVILCTEGFSIEKAREILKKAEELGFPICPLHDFDINGLLIKETLTKPTKRLDIHLNPENVIDLGLNWEIVNRLMREKGLIPEPVELRLADVTKLEGMLSRGEITEEAYRFLLGKPTEKYFKWKQGEKVKPQDVLARGFRVELQALRPSELIEWLERRLDELGLWKTLPSQEELNEELYRYMRAEIEWLLSDLEVKIDDLIIEISEWIEKELGLDEIWDALGKMRQLIVSKVTEIVKNDVRLPKVDELELPTLTVEELKELLKQSPDSYWTKVARRRASELLIDLKADIKDDVLMKLDEVENEMEEITEIVLEKPEVNEHISYLRATLLDWCEEVMT